MHDSSWSLTFIAGACIAILIMQSIDSREEKEFATRSLSRMQHMEVNLSIAEDRLNKIQLENKKYCYSQSLSMDMPVDQLCQSMRDIGNALSDLRLEIADLHKKLDK